MLEICNLTATSYLIEIYRNISDKNEGLRTKGWTECDSSDGEEKDAGRANFARHLSPV